MSDTNRVRDHYTQRSASDRRSRAIEALRFTARNATHPWLRKLALTKHWEAVAIEKLAGSGYLVRFDRTDPRSVW